MVEIMAKETEKKKAEEAYFITTKELAEAGRDNIPRRINFLKAPYLQLTSYTCV